MLMLVHWQDGMPYLHPLCALLALAFGAWMPAVARTIQAACRAASALARRF